MNAFILPPPEPVEQMIVPTYQKETVYPLLFEIFFFWFLNSYRWLCQAEVLTKGGLPPEAPKE